MAALLCAPATVAQTQRGKATYYSRRATGSRTASGERIHHDSLTCAHRNYPFGTLLKVTNLSNGKQVTVRVTDRGPFAKGRIIDLSYGAAKELGLLAQGVGMVEVEAVGTVFPLKQTEVLEFPEIDFDVTDAAYSFVDEWKKTPARQGKKPQAAAPQKGSQPQQAAPQKSQRPQQKRQADPQKPKSDKGKAGNEKKDAGFWRSVFDKAKHFGDDLF